MSADPLLSDDSYISIEHDPGLPVLVQREAIDHPDLELETIGLLAFLNAHPEMPVTAAAVAAYKPIDLPKIEMMIGKLVAVGILIDTDAQDGARA